MSTDTETAQRIRKALEPLGYGVRRIPEPWSDDVLWCMESSNIEDPWEYTPSCNTVLGSEQEAWEHALRRSIINKAQTGVRMADLATLDPHGLRTAVIKHGDPDKHVAELWLQAHGLEDLLKVTA